MKKAVLYVRVNSTQEEAEKQLEQLWAFAESKGYKVANAYYEVISGVAHVHERTILNMLEDAKNGQFDTVIIRDITRLGRNHEDVALILTKLGALGIKIVPQRDNVDLTFLEEPRV